MEKLNDTSYVLTVNAGSSSIKLGLFAARDISQKVSEAVVENIGLAATSLVTKEGTAPVVAANHSEAIRLLAEWLATHITTDSIIAVGHRIVHGGPRYRTTQFANPEVLTDLQKLTVFDPAHMPVELEIITALRAIMPQARQVLCFDTAFHDTMPIHARLLPIPRHFATEGVRRYGFHGLSYAYVVEELRRVEGDAAANGKVIIAHLGSGASVTALQNGRSIDTTMSMTPASGIPMSTRAGDLDPGLALYFAQTHHYDATRFNHMINFESGLLGISGTTADMKLLLESEDTDAHAKDAVDVFCYQLKKNIGSLAAALGGIHTLVFTGGMGENAPKIRARACAGLEFLGVTIDDARNQSGARLISADGGGVGVHVIHTDEAITIAREIAQLLANQKDEA